MIEQLFVIDTGYCRHPECTVIRGGRLAMATFPSTVVVLVHRKHGVILLDAGYSPRFAAATRRGLPRLYAMTTPVTARPDQTAVAQLKALGIEAADVSHVILSHFHADHISGLRDFPRAKLLFRDVAYEQLQGLGAVRRLLHGYLPPLLPDDFTARAQTLRVDTQSRGILTLSPFTDGYDLFGDASVVAVDLPGHAPGQLGLVVQSTTETTFFVSDAAWLAASITQLRPPSMITRLIMDDFKQYRTTLSSLHALHLAHPKVRIVPCHCTASNAPLLKKVPTPLACGNE